MHAQQLCLSFLAISLVTFVARVRSDTGKIEPVSGGTLVSISDCFYLFLRHGTVQEREGEVIPIGNASSASGNCVSGNTTQPSDVQIEFTFPENVKYSKLVLNLEFEQPEPTSGYWKAGKAKAELTSAARVDVLTLDVNEIYSLDRFSFSCSEMLLTVTGTEDAAHTTAASITLHNFQVQGFNGQVFEESFDCSPWFTLGMWMGLIVILFFVTIITIGICFIVSVQTNDRFEDPRGKPLSIPVMD